MQENDDLKRQVKFGRRLVKTLRHTAVLDGFHISSDGFILISELLHHPLYKGLQSVDIEEIVKKCPKQRMFLRGDIHSNDFAIRANQGHSLKNVQVDLKAIHSSLEIPICIHGTFQTHLDSICNTVDVLIIRFEWII